MKTHWGCSKSVVFLQVCFWVLTALVAAGAQPRLEPLPTGKWPALALLGDARNVKVVGQRAYVALGDGGLVVFDVSDPANWVPAGACDTPGYALSVAVAGSYAYVADDYYGLEVIDVSNPTNCVCVAGYGMGRNAYGVAVVGDRICLADGAGGVLVLASLANVQFAVRVNDAAPGTPCVVEASRVLGPAAQWMPVFTNAAPSGPFDFVDLDVRVAEHPQKFYRARQP